MAEFFESDVWVHFEELMSRLRKIVYVMVFSIVVVMSLPADLSKLTRLDFNEYELLVTVLMEYIQDTLLPDGVTLIAFNWLDSFYIYMSLSFAISFTVTLPYLAYQVYGFIAPAIYENEKRSIFMFVIVFMALFLFGATYSYYVIVTTTFSVLYKFVYQTRVMPFYAVKDFFDVITFGLLGSGLLYTFPIVIYFLVQLDLILLEELRSMRRHLFVGLSILTAVLTPDPTPVSMILMTIPFYILFEITIIILSITMRNRPDKTLVDGLMAAEEMLNRKNLPKEQVLFKEDFLEEQHRSSDDSKHEGEE
ncbi:preprotein translocase subunit TatC [Candidatus Bathyarchaeota archaeon]|nr:preprotein translocase subunit TatC [Candidatus Bathyarchaeota archaeon]